MRIKKEPRAEPRKRRECMTKNVKFLIGVRSWGKESKVPGLESLRQRSGVRRAERTHREY